MVAYRWDQGRLLYFQFDHIKRMAKALVGLDGLYIGHGQTGDPLRQVLETSTGLPFLPKSYKVWRNYKRVFECALLATEADGYLFVSDIARWLSTSSEVDVDDYLTEVFRRFRYPFPAFQGYDPTEEVVYPFCAFLKFCLANWDEANTRGFTLDDLLGSLVKKRMSGQESLLNYRGLGLVEYHSKGDELRQIREMIAFMGQGSILKWFGKRLYLDAMTFAADEANDLVVMATPLYAQPLPQRAADFAQITSMANDEGRQIQSVFKDREKTMDYVFTEGRRVRMTHVKIERSQRLRSEFFKQYPTTVCNMCAVDLARRYPWAGNLLELHHLLPLSSALAISHRGTSLLDVVPICPTCHRSVHSFYKQWLDRTGQPDFTNKTEAMAVYEMAKKSLTI